MSEYLTVEVEYEDHALFMEAMEAAAEQMKFEFEHHESAMPLYGYRGKQRQQKAEFVVRRRHIDSSANDIGWRLNENGSYELVISRYDMGSERRRGWQIAAAVDVTYKAAIAEQQMKSIPAFMMSNIQRQKQGQVVQIVADNVLG